MKKFSFAGLIGLSVLLSAFTSLNAITWKIADGYAIKFAGNDAEGVFSKMTGDISFDEANVEAAKMSVSIDVTSINTGNGMKNGHAKSSKWFDAKKFPAIKFTSSKFSKSAEGYTVTGQLELHGITKEVAIPFTFANNTFKGKFQVNRMDYGVGNMEGMSKKVSNEIKLDITVPVTKK